MVLDRAGAALTLRDLPMPVLQGKQVIVEVRACGVCRTDLHVVDGELTNPKLPLVPGHEIIGRICRVGREAKRFKPGDRVGIAWLAWACGECRFCKRGQENLCERGSFTGYTVDGGYAEYTLAHEDFCFRLPDGGTDGETAPLMCAGLIGYRSYRMLPKDARTLGLYGFGAAAHILAQVAKFQGKEIYAFTRAGDLAGQQFARSLGAVWAGGSDELPPARLDAAIIFAPAGALIPAALKALDKGGVVICGGIHMSDIPSFPYEALWEERVVRSVANVTRADGTEFLELAPKAGVKATVTTFPLEQANEALSQLRHGKLEGAAVLQVSSEGDCGLQ
jgi:propanol-preferring alcohol dehydrogenase